MVHGVNAWNADRYQVADDGDRGPGYLPTAAASGEGGYETSWVALVAPEAEGVIAGAIQDLLVQAG